MKYKNTLSGRFKKRPNRFIAYVEIEGKEEICHVKNTGRCKELLTENAEVWLSVSDNPNRKTKYDIVNVNKNGMLINMDSQAPNPIFEEWILKSGFFGENPLVKRECKYKNSRFDFYVESGERKIFVETKGVTLEKEGIAMFPDAPTERGIKHIHELCEAVSEGYEAYVFFIIQMKPVKYFIPNRETHNEFAEALCEGVKRGVRVFALDCIVSEYEVCADGFVEVRVTEDI